MLFLVCAYFCVVVVVFFRTGVSDILSAAWKDDDVDPKKKADSKVRIFLHHSSVPYQNHDVVSPTVVRSHLGNAVKKIMTPNV